ncbi:LANO_0H00342g1_1 [Lachancea nothofagi CBS 11611]|uniref:LANO_0H00342g1_1 n=1 Tax=Lachancea nothofagi CBS 11611 TaxID=1266666 RepID=A0A1G4KKN0_9SACH|nr:LANO_0H00342g1_1 [Lachancea nothofagi CBS 11611]
MDAKKISCINERNENNNSTLETPFMWAEDFRNEDDSGKLILQEDKVNLDFELGSESDVSTSSISSRPKSWLCEYEGCTKAFSRPSQLTEHQETVHRGLKPFRCSKCDKTFARKSHLERHMFSHSDEKPLKCSVCEKGFTTEQQLRRHAITHTKSFKCPYENCIESFYKHPQLRSHILAVHLQKLNCEFCGKKFQRPYRLKAHVAKHHNPDAVFKYQCTHGSCLEAFKTWTGLQQHIKEQHPKILCPVCKKPCVGESGLAMHMKIHSNSTVIKNWQCESCDDLSFAKKAGLMSHYVEYHKDLVSRLVEREEEAEQEVLRISASVPDPLELALPKRSILKTGQTHNSDLDSIQTEVTLRKFLDTGKSSVSLLLNSAGRKHRCPYSKCYRTFKTQEKFDLHIQKHKIHELKLKILQEKENTEQTKDGIQEIEEGTLQSEKGAV